MFLHGKIKLMFGRDFYSMYIQKGRRNASPIGFSENHNLQIISFADEQPSVGHIVEPLPELVPGKRRPSILLLCCKDVFHKTCL
jgi:hypothetical protein